MRNQLTVNAAKGAGFKVIGWVFDDKLNQEILQVENSRGTGRYFDPLNHMDHAIEVAMILNMSIKIDASQDRIIVSTDDLSQAGYYVSVKGNDELTNKRKGNVLRELITFLAADHS